MYSSLFSNMLQIQHDIIYAAKENQWLINKKYLENNPSNNTNIEIKKPEDRLTVLCIAYHNIAVE